MSFYNHVHGFYDGYHPTIRTILFLGIQRQWFLKYKKWITVRPMTELGILQYQFLDESDNSI